MEHRHIIGRITKSPHITENEKFGKVLIDAINKFNPKTILDIGASYGDGSTQLFYDHSEADIYAIELHEPSYKELCERFSNLRVHPYRVGTSKKVMPKKKLESFQKEFPHWDRWKTFSKEDSEKWRKDTQKELKKVDADGIETIKKEHGIENFGLVLIDGGPYSTTHELDKVLGSTVIALDDVNDIKNYENYMTLKESNYKLFYQDLNYRNGIAIFYNG